MDYKFVIENNFINSEPFISSNDIRAFSIEQRQNGEYVGIVRVSNGTRYVKNLFSYNPMLITIPVFTTSYERDAFIRNLYQRGFTQHDISIFMGLSQPSISLILRRI